MLMQDFTVNVSCEERRFYQGSLVLLEGAISEFLSCLEMMRRYRLSRGRRDPVATCSARVKSAASMKDKLERLGYAPTTFNALHKVYDAAGVRVICPLVDDIYQVAAMVRRIPEVEVLNEKDYIRRPKPNGYRSYHMILRMPLRFTTDSSAISMEIQLRTIAMDCWASIEHQLKYKQSIPNQGLIVSELKRCADEIASTDLSLQTIRDMLEGKQGVLTGNSGKA